MKLRSKNKRYWEIDFFRGIAIIIMIFFHFLYDLNHFSITEYRLYTGYFSYLANATASIFILLVGISLYIRYNRIKKDHSDNHFIINTVWRGFRIFLLGIVITGITFWYIPQRYIVFGVLHCIGVSIILSIPFVRYQKISGIIGILLICIGIYIRMFRFDFTWLLPIGFAPYEFTTIDYFPLLPWFGVVLLGIIIGDSFYPRGDRKFLIQDRSETSGIKQICFLGRNSLYIYFFHQPILLGLIYFFHN